MIGNMTIDDLVFPDGTTRMGVPGGDAVYASIGASLWGANVHVCSICGFDYPVDMLVREYSVNLSAVRRIDAPSLRNWGLYEQDGTRQFIFRNRGLNWSDYSPRACDLPSSLVRSAPAHIAVLPWAHQLELAQALRRAGTPLITLDPDYHYMEVMSPSEIDVLVQLIDVFMPSRQEAMALFGPREPRDLLACFITQYPKLKSLVLKLGEEGSLAFERDTGCVFKVPAYPTRLVDPTGAGDAFCGGVLAGLAEGLGLVDAVLRGTVSASFVVEQFGTTGLGVIARCELEERLESLRTQVDRLE